MITDYLQKLFSREIHKVKAEIETYQHEKNIWIVNGQIANSGGNLCLHLIGNLNTFIGVQLGNSDYVRNRDLEFSQKDVPRADLLSMLDHTHELVLQTIRNLNKDKMSQDFPVAIMGEVNSVEYTLLHLLSHLSYHLGQINYHRRLLDA